ncbi:hypothetical protein D9M71_750870 [compost metagenome]
MRAFSAAVLPYNAGVSGYCSSMYWPITLESARASSPSLKPGMRPSGLISKNQSGWWKGATISSW